MRDNELQLRHEARLAPVDEANTRVLLWSTRCLVGMFGGVGAAAAIEKQDRTAAAVLGVSGVVLSMVGLIGALTTAPSVHEDLEAGARQKLLIRWEDDVDAAARGIHTTIYGGVDGREITVDVNNVKWNGVVNLPSSATAVWDYEYHAQVTSGCELLRSDITGAGSSTVSQQVAVDYVFYVDPESGLINQVKLSFLGPSIKLSGVRQGRHTVEKCDGTSHESEVGIPWEDDLVDAISITDTLDPMEPDPGALSPWERSCAAVETPSWCWPPSN